ncbi:MAG: fumarylacetoacetate hydrolase family protein [Acidobacteria bacterium]|nr:fumarylacetoacetate hydrolase family protein [Acidobacteriota bacterium]
MKLATLKDKTRDGTLIVVTSDLRRAVSAQFIAATMQAALDDWAHVEPRLQSLAAELNAGKAHDAFAFDAKAVAAPLPRAYQWCDGSAFLNHGRLMEKAFNTPPMPDFETIPLIYQGGSDDFLGACDDVPFVSEADGIDFEGEFGVIVDDVPMGCSPADAATHIKLIVQINDWSLRGYGPREMKTGFGFFQAKPATSFAPVAVTPDELGAAWRDGRIHLPLNIQWNGAWFGHPNGSEMNFSFYELIAHAAKTRRLRAGTIIGSGTVSSADRSAGSACISERRVIEMIDAGASKTAFMRFGDSVRMEVLDADGHSIFGAIEQRLVRFDFA